MRLTYVIGTTSGGVGTHVRAMAGRLVERGLTVTVAGPQSTQEQFDFSAAGALFVPVAIGSAPNPRADLQVVRSLRRVLADADLVHAHGLRATALSALALGRRRPDRKPLLSTWHNAILERGVRRAALRLLETVAARRSDLTMAVSSDLVSRAAGVGAPDAMLFPVAAPRLPAASRDRDLVRADLGVGDDDVVALAVGRAAPQKDYATLLDATARWADDSHDSVAQPVVLVAGDGPELPALGERVRSQRLPVRLLGHRTDVADLLGAADLYVLTSRWEGRPLVIQEAMHAGLAVVATAGGGTPDLLGDAGRLVPVGDAAAISAAVLELTSDRTARADLGQRARQRAAEWPDEAANADALATLYREQVARQAARK
ncbi:MAG TPA: glycosyltransferase family 4 protein [Jiangellaceae bacterium]|nr:glycosyltransferase family 4 protein [Jiangellaceae bacterium]